jgi:hypothetical protein
MDSRHDLFSRIGAVARSLAAKLRPRSPSLIGTPPSARLMRHDDPTAHASDFSERYAQDLDLIVAQRMQDLGVPDRQNGRPDPDAGGRWRAFFPHQTDGGGVVGDQINADAGLFDTGLMDRRYGPEIGGKWAKDRLRDRLDQVIAHEYAEAIGISHDEAVQRAAETPLAIRETARERLRAMAETENRGKRLKNS